MDHRIATADGTKLYVSEQGKGPAIVLANSLGTDTRLWDAVLPLLPARYRIIRYDKRGHGRSGTPSGPYKMGTLVADAEAICDTLGVTDAVFAGVSIGGMIGQALAVKRPDLIRALILSNTSVKSGTADGWHARIAAVEAGGLRAIADDVMDRWFAPGFTMRSKWRERFLQNDAVGYMATCAAIAGTDLMTSTSGLRLPTLAIAGDQDGAAPPDVVRELADLIPGSRFTLIRGAGHLPPVETPQAFASHFTAFLKSIAH